MSFWKRILLKDEIIKTERRVVSAKDEVVSAEQRVSSAEQRVSSAKEQSLKSKDEVVSAEQRVSSTIEKWKNETVEITEKWKETENELRLINQKHLRMTNNFNVRGAIEFVRAEILGEKEPSVKVSN